MIKSLFRLSLRMVTAFVQSLIQFCGLSFAEDKNMDIEISCQKNRHPLRKSKQMRSIEWNKLLKRLSA